MGLRPTDDEVSDTVRKQTAADTPAVFPASPLKNNDEGSLDIYAGLDSAGSGM